MGQTIYRFKTGGNNFVVARVIGSGLRAKIDLRVFKKNSRGKETLPTENGITISREALPELIRTVQNLVLARTYWG